MSMDPQPQRPRRAGSAPQPQRTPAFSRPEERPERGRDEPPREGQASPGRPGGRDKLVAGALGVVAVVVGVLAMRGPVPMIDDDRSPNWDRIQEVTAANADTPAGSNSKLMKINLGGGGEIVGAIALAEEDVDDRTTSSVKQAIQAAGPAAAPDAAMAEVAGVQDIPEPKTAEAKQEVEKAVAEAKPTLSAGMVQAIQEDEAKFYRIYMFDNCFQDGDVVRIWIDNEVFAVVPITNQGATLSVPLSAKQAYSIVIEGVYDGGGGITVACKTSDGTYFTKVMVPREKQQLAFVGLGR